MITIDGNFQLKRFKGAGNKAYGQKLPPLYNEEDETQLWGSREEVEAQSNHVVQEDSNLDVLEKNFKAVSSRHSKKPVFDENGVFAVGERHKYALASVASVLKNGDVKKISRIIKSVKPMFIQNEFQFVMSVFHSFAHQMEYNSRYIP